MRYIGLYFTSNHLVQVSDQDRIRLMALKPDLASLEVASLKRPGGGMKPDYKNIQWMNDSDKQGFRWSAAGVAGLQLPVNLISVLHGCDVIRTGLEDNRYMLQGVPAANNVELVSRAAALIRLLGHPVANPSDMADILRIKG